MPEIKHQFAIIGAGEIGSRHLQGLCRTLLPASIYVIDPSPKSLALAEERARQILPSKTHIDLIFSSDFSSLPPSLDVAIISTSSLIRLDALRKLLSNSKVRYLILEKIAFPSRSSFADARDLIYEHEVKTWVNCPRRMNPAYKLIRNRLNNHKATNMSVTGWNYGLACNSIHFIDLFSFITCKNGYTMSSDGLIPEIFPSKRPGYVEFYGRLDLDFTSGNKLVLRCDSIVDQKTDFKIQISAAEFEIVIDEIKNLVTVNKDPLKLFDGLTYKSIYQSDMTNLIVENLIVSNTCDLTPFADSMLIHLPFIDMASDFYAKITGKTVEAIPIT